MEGAPRPAWLRRETDSGHIRNVGEVIREYRLAIGLNQAAVASALGITQQFLSQLETGARDPDVEHRRRIAAVLGIPLEELGMAGRQRRRAAEAVTPAAVVASRGRWRVQRHWLNRHRAELGRLAAHWYPSDNRLPGTSLLTGEGWLPSQPVELQSVRLRLHEGPQPVQVAGTEEQTLAVRPLRTAETAFDSYSAAVKHLDPPRLFESRPSYRLLAGSVSSGVLDFGLGSYFDKLDVSEALAHELAAACMEHWPSHISTLQGRLPFRELVGDPFEPARRAMIPAITTLTIRLRRYPAEPSFLLHWRDPARVATAAGMYDVIPAGEFQPSSVALWDRRNDFSLWRNMVREFAEELLGSPEYDGSRSAAIDYERWPLYQRLGAAQTEGKIRAHILGLGVDALTLAATILTVVVIDDDVFDDVFGTTVQFNDEGEVVAVEGGRAADGVPFTAAAVERLLENEPVAAPGAACLTLAWQHRDSLIS
ncbi:helix-turn-helix transcriptional regulator [Nocardia beijingensis]|uniref:helix-turn-helix domain-containing protein n=1 Tax=Nocardia beijingensis TaxID=95162 RepID=UPI00331D269D